MKLIDFIDKEVEKFNSTPGFGCHCTRNDKCTQEIRCKHCQKILDAIRSSVSLAHTAGFAAGRLSGLEEARLITSDESKKRHGCSDCGAKEVDEGYNYGRWSASVDIGDAITKAKGETS